MLPCRRNRLAFARGLALLAALGVGSILGPAACAADTPTTHLAVRAFEIPYAIEANQSFKQLILQASTDRKTYTPEGTTQNRKGVFPYTAKADGEYFFVVQVEDPAGILSPSRPELAAPTLRVIVDTQKPKVELRAVLPKQGRAAVEWRIDDANLDIRTLHLETKGPGETAWTPQKITLLKDAQYGWNPTGGGPIAVRLSVKDLAGNETVATTQVTPSAGAAPAPGQTDEQQVRFVKHKKFHLRYKIEMDGPSDVKEVQVWMTTDRSQWSKFGPSAPKNGPFVVTVNSAGRYGFTLRPISGVGRGPAAPRAGDAPQIWVEVDETKPEVRLNNVHVGEGVDSGKVVVNWSATDKFLKDKPVTITYSEKAEGPWKTLQENQENTGTAKVTPPSGVYEFFVKVEAVDKAGNVGSAQLRESIKVDLAVPKAVDIGVESIDPTSATGGSGEQSPP